MARNKYDVDEALEKDAEFNIVHLLRLKKYVKPYIKPLALTIILMLLGSALALTTPYIYKTAVDVALPNKDMALITGLALFHLFVLGINYVFMKFKLISLAKVGQGIIRDLRLDLFKHLQELPFVYYDSRPHGKILVRVVNYINSLSDMLSNGIVSMVTELFTLFVILAIMLLMDLRH